LCDPVFKSGDRCACTNTHDDGLAGKGCEPGFDCSGADCCEGCVTDLGSGMGARRIGALGNSVGTGRIAGPGIGSARQVRGIGSGIDVPCIGGLGSGTVARHIGRPGVGTDVRCIGGLGSGTVARHIGRPGVGTDVRCIACLATGSTSTRPTCITSRARQVAQRVHVARWTPRVGHPTRRTLRGNSRPSH
jgi:hypothetical protein